MCLTSGFKYVVFKKSEMATFLYHDLARQESPSVDSLLALISLMLAGRDLRRHVL